MANKTEYIKTLIIVNLVVVIFISLIWVLILQDKITDLEIENIKIDSSYTPLSVWEENPEWSFEHLWYEDSRFMVGRINNERYVLEYDNWDVNESFEITFDFDGTCELLLFNNSCKSMTQDGCYQQYIIENNVAKGWMNF
jgi:hypothetical protein